LSVINEAVLVTFAAQLVSLPLLIYYFRQLSLISLVVNPLVLPAQTGVMAFGLLALAAGLMAIPLGQIVGWSAWIFLAWTTSVIHLFAAIPNAAIPLDYVSPAWIVAYYALLMAITWFLQQPRDRRPRVLARLLTRRNVIVGGGMAVLLLSVALSWLPDGKLHIAALAADGHPVLVRTPSNRKILIGGSNSPSSLLAALGHQLPFWDRDIDLLVAPQANAAQLNGLLAVLDRYSVRQVMAVNVPDDTRAGREWQAALSAKSLQPIELQSIEIEPGVDLAFDGSSVLIRSPGGVIAIGPSEQAHINLIVQKIDRLPANPQLILVLEPAFEPDQFDPRVIGLIGRGGVDLTCDGSGISIRAAR
jgi:competence protein ComEC